MQSLVQSQKQQNDICVRFPGKPFNNTVIQVCVPTTDAKEAEVDWSSEDV